MTEAGPRTGSGATGMQILVPDRLATGRVIDLARPEVEFDWKRDMAEPAARLNRFAGQIPDLCYSVAEHECHGADAIEFEGLADLMARGVLGHERMVALRAIRTAALGFLIHDQHETLGGDVKRPFTDLCELLAAQSGLAPGGLFRRIVEAAKDHLDVSIYAQAGLAFPLDPAARMLVHAMDERMAAEEMRRFWPDSPPPLHYQSLQPIADAVWARDIALRTWSWPRAAAEWFSRFVRLRAQLARAED